MLLSNLTAKISIQKGIDQLLLRGSQVLLIVTIICLIVPFVPSMPKGDLDPSWVFGMNQALAQGLAIGRDVVFTFGPYASIYTKAYHPATDHLMLYGSLYLAFSYGLVLFLLVKNSGWFMVGGFSLFLVGTGSSHSVYDSVYLSYSLVVSILCLKANGRLSKDRQQRNQTLLEIIFLFFPLGLLPLIKGSFLLMSAVAVVLVAISFSLRKQWGSVIAVVVVPIASTVIFWNLSGQESVIFSAYFKSLAPIISGYTEGMALDGPKGEVLLYLVATLVLLLVVICEPDMQLEHRFLAFLAFSAYLFIAFKSGFVRHDGHALIAGTAIVIASFVAAFAFRSPYILLAISISFGAWLYIDQNYLKTSTSQLVNRLKSTYMSAWQGAKSRLTGDDELESRFDDAIKNLRSKAKFPIFKGTTDIYSFNQAYLIASGNAWNPRPIFQSYAAYTPTLAKINRKHLLGENAPENVIFRVEPIDGRLPAIEDGASWPALLTGYIPSAKSDGFLYLHRKNSDSPLSEEMFLRSGTYSFGETVPVPKESAPIFVELSIKPSLSGRLVSAFYKPSQLQINLELENGRKVTYRLVAGMVSSGFVVSPLIETTDEFGLLYGGLGYLDGKSVKSFSISPVGRKRQWNKVYEVAFKKFELSKNVDVSDIYDFDRFVGNIPRSKISLVAKCDGSIDAVNGVSPVPKPSLRGFMSVRGWLAKSVEDGIVGDSVLVVLRDSAGGYRFLSTKKAMRPDVGAHFKKPVLDHTGFVSTADLGAISGDYILGLAYMDGDQVGVCSTFNIPIRVNGASAHEKD
jgi:hypothetical protein